MFENFYISSVLKKWSVICQNNSFDGFFTFDSRKGGEGRQGKVGGERAGRG